MGQLVHVSLAEQTPSPHPTSSTLRGKFAQIVMAQRIAMRTSKRDLLEQYVNRVPMGGNLYGVEAAARTYFGEPASDPMPHSSSGSP